MLLCSSEKEAYQFKVQGQLFALYAARSPDFFFGTAFCAPIAQAVENVISQPSGILPQPFFSRQQPFDNSLTAQTTPYMQNPGTPNQASMFMKNGYQPNVGRQGHTDTLKALKRKIQENYTCKPPVKVARMVNSLAHRNTYSPQQETTPLPASFESNIYRNSFGPLVGGSDYHHGMGQGPMQVMYAHNLSTVMMSPKEKSYMPDVFPSKPMYEEKPLEQVVPDVSVPACYLTPEPSPVSSPEPPTKCESVHSVKDSKSIDPVLVAKHLCVLKQRQITENPLTNPVGEPRKHLNPAGEPRKLLPSLDAFYVDSFFNEIDHVSLTREEEIILLQNIAKGKITVKEEPIEQEACKENHEPLANDFDIEEFLQFTEKPKEEVVKVKIESRTDDQQVMSFDNSPSPSSPYSTISTADEKFGSDDLSSFALTPESGFESDSLDDVLDPDCWDLESVKMDMSLTSIQPNISTFRVNPVAHPEPELYQLKQLISSCTPSGKYYFITLCVTKCSCKCFKCDARSVCQLVSLCFFILQVCRISPKTPSRPLCKFRLTIYFPYGILPFSFYFFVISMRSAGPEVVIGFDHSACRNSNIFAIYCVLKKIAGRFCASSTSWNKTLCFFLSLIQLYVFVFLLYCF